MKNLFIFGIVCLIVACNTPKPNWAKECAERFPSRTDTFRLTTEKVKVDTFFLKGMTVPYYIKTICPPSDTVRLVANSGTIECPPFREVVKTKILHDSVVIYRANTAQETLLKSKIDSLNSESEALKRVNRSLLSDIEGKKRQTQRLTWLSVIGWIIVALFSFLTYKIWKANH